MSGNMRTLVYVIHSEVHAEGNGDSLHLPFYFG